MSPHTPGLTPRQRQVLDGLARGLRRAEIAAELGVTEASIKTTSLAVYRKLDVHNRAAAVTAAVRAGIIPDPTQRRLAEIVTELASGHRRMHRKRRTGTCPGCYLLREAGELLDDTKADTA